MAKNAARLTAESSVEALCFEPRGPHLAAERVPAATELSTLAGWNQTEGDWRMLLDISPEGCFAIEYEGSWRRPTMVICYGQELAWLGMVLTHPDYRRRGFARSLLEHALAFADGRNVRSLQA